MGDKIKTQQAGQFGLWNKYYILIAVLFVLASAANYVFNTALPLFMDSVGITESKIGVQATVMTVSAAIFRIIGGRLADKNGRRTVMIVGAFLFSAASFMFMFTSEFVMILVLRAFQGAGFALSTSAMSIASIDVIPPERLGEGIGYFGMGNSLSQAIGPSLSIALFYSTGSFGGIRAISITSGTILFACAMLAVISLRYEKNPIYAKPVQEKPEVADVPAEPQVKRSFIWKFLEKSAIPAGIVAFCNFMGAGIISSFVVLYATKNDIPNPGLFFTCAAICIILARLLTGRIIDRYGSVYSLVPGFAAAMIALLLLVFAPQYNALFYVAGVLYGFSSGMVSPAINKEAMSRATADRRGAASATYYIPIDLGFAVSAVVGGAAIEVIGYQTTFAASIAFFAIGAGLSIIFFRKNADFSFWLR